MIKILYKLVNLVVSVLGGILAGAIFKRIWKAAAGEDEAPKATDAQSGWREVLVAATLQGAIFALVKAAVDRAVQTHWPRWSPMFLTRSCSPRLRSSPATRPI